MDDGGTTGARPVYLYPPSARAPLRMSLLPDRACSDGSLVEVEIDRICTFRLH